MKPYDPRKTFGKTVSIPEIPRPINKKVLDHLRDFVHTGEFRCPKEGEWIVGMTGYPRKVGLDYGIMKFHILRRKIQVVEDENESQKELHPKGKHSTR